MYTVCAVGQDSHRFTQEDKSLILGGVLFKGHRGLAANSDGDVVLHAITNAVSGLTAVNILGKPADDMCRNGIKDSSAYLELAMKYMKEKKLRLIHISVSIECKTPKITPEIERMREKIGKLCGILPEQIGITATTGENLTDCGRGKGIAVICIVTAMHE